VEHKGKGHGHEGKHDGKWDLEDWRAEVERDGGCNGDREGKDARCFGLGEGGEALFGCGAKFLLLRDFIEERVAINLVEIGYLAEPGPEGVVDGEGIGH